MKVFITGASSGIGAALARHYAGQRAVLGLFARREGSLSRIAAALGTECRVYAGDVRDAAALRSAAEDFLARYGAPDVVIANAGISVGTSTAAAEDAEVFRTIMDTNVLGVVHTFAPFIEAMTRARHGALVGVASVAGFRGLPGAGAYSASKAAVLSFLESLRVELRDSGVSVITLCPGYVATAITAGNPYRMPFMLCPDTAARLMAGAIERKRAFYVLPWQMGLIGRVLRLLPRSLYDRVFARAPRKPRAPRN